MKNKNYRSFGILTGDILIAVFILFVAVVMFISFTVDGQNKNNKSAFVYIDNELFQKLPLDKATEVKISQDEIEMTIGISDGGVKIQNSNCKNQNCVKMGSISTQNQVIACMPNRVYILIESEADNAAIEFDAIIG